MKPSKTDYFLSLAAELNAHSSRVRQLIGDAHWGHDGRHKEILLADMIRRHSPSPFVVSSGFVVSPNNAEVRSSEQDILVIDTSTEAPLFHQGDLVIVFPHTVIAAISVKSTMNNTMMRSVIDGLQTVREVARDGNTEPNRIWCGGFFYTVDDSWVSEPGHIYRSIKEHILANPAPRPIVDSGQPHVLGPDLIADSKEMAFIVDYERCDDKSTARIRGYVCKGAATAVFLSCMLEHVSLRLTGTRSVFSDFLSDLEIPQLEPSVVVIIP
jgi:hypothetical protein